MDKKKIEETSPGISKLNGYETIFETKEYDEEIITSFQIKNNLYIITNRAVYGRKKKKWWEFWK